MKHIKSFAEFVNESILNEESILTPENKKAIKEISDLTAKFINKDVPSLLSKYGCELESDGIKGTGSTNFNIVRPGSLKNKTKEKAAERLFTIYTFQTKHNYRSTMVAYGYMNPFFDDYNLRTKMPFSIGSAQDVNSDTIKKMFKQWQYGDYEFLNDPKVIGEYVKFLSDYLKGIEENLKFFESKGII
jgi:hypothetical protein